jgi:hypothetical protein
MVPDNATPDQTPDDTVIALPQAASATDPWLVWNHRQYNQRLLDLAALHPDSLSVFDL